MAGRRSQKWAPRPTAESLRQFCAGNPVCIDKSSSAELSEAINSMFHWYQNATACYVYLSDVSSPREAPRVHLSPTTEVTFRESRWFRRGWTLQELLAPKDVEFFSREGHRLGSKRSLEQQIHEITGIAVGALRAGRVTDFGVEERFSWAKHRETKRPEDRAYSLLGIFGIHMPLLYGEGREKAYARLRKEIDTSQNYPLLKTISHIGDAAYDSYENQRHRTCLANTRVDLLQGIIDWTASDSSQYIFWLKGGAGTGKSTIALTIAQSLGKLDVSLVISSIAFQLAIRSRLFGGFVCEALREDPNLGESASISQQYNKLLLRPLQKVRQSTTDSPLFIVVLDALNECDDFDDVRLLLRLLGNTQDMAGLGLRLLVTSRPEIPIRLGFHNMKHIAYHELALHDVPRVIVDQDIERFVAHELTRIKAERGLPDSWPGDDKIHLITTRAAGLFIYAATLCRYVDGPWQVSVSTRLEQVCYGSGAKHKSTEALDEMYLIVMDSLMKEDFSAEEIKEVTLRLRQVVGSLVSLFENLSAKDLTRLLFPTIPIGGFIVKQTLGSLHAVFDVPKDPSKPVQMLHLSFRDFIVDSARCPDARFRIHQEQAHRDLSDCCLNLMRQSLGQNICQLPRRGMFIDDVSEATLRHYLPFGLRYVCRHWISHVGHGRVCLSDNGTVHIFLQQFCHYWIEVMSLINKFPEATNMMIQSESLIDVNIAPELHSLVQDILRFMLSFTYVLNKAPLQLYSAGLLFSPTNSIFRKTFTSQTSIEFEFRTQLLSEWSACVQTLEGHLSRVKSVVFSPDGSRLASGSGDRTVRVWDVQRGRCQHTLEGHLYDVYSVVFSPDGSRLASGSEDDTVRVWDVQTGRCQHTLKGHSSHVYSVVFSPDGSRLASGSEDNTVRVWDVQTGRCQHTLEGHLSHINSVVFSPDGSRLASGSGDGTVRVWDLVTWTELMSYNIGSYQKKIEFSDDSMKMTINGDLLSVPSQTRVASTAAGSPGPSRNMPASKLSIIGDWVTWSSERVLWLPPEYRPGNWASKGNTIAIGSGTGRVTFMSFAATQSSPL